MRPLVGPVWAQHQQIGPVRRMTKAQIEGQLLDFIAAALLDSGYNSVLNMPDQLDRALRRTMDQTGLGMRFAYLNFSIRGMHLALLLGDAPRKKCQHYTRWIAIKHEELPRCEYHFNTNAQDVFNGLAERHNTGSIIWAKAARFFVDQLENEEYKVLVRPDETHKQVRARFPSRG